VYKSLIRATGAEPDDGHADRTGMLPRRFRRHRVPFIW
jgi:hypothetical protein